MNSSLDRVSAKKLVSALIAKESKFREREGVGRSANGNVGFEPPNWAGNWLARISIAQEQSSLETLMPIYTFVSTIMAHPFADGNGRLARLLSLASLLRLSGLSHPIIGVSPSFYRFAETLGAALDELTSTGDWRPVTDCYISIIDDALLLGAALKERY
ncbi:Fic family protein [uncultured Sphingomonas sp.]|uniref:Fic family protein n=1 Tax=uncultured Sphingomonas sp. TaxID=158754 RepID=UPI0025F6EE10|nr:Fic family protein [uncultured Sphingomonas sp.]